MDKTNFSKSELSEMESLKVLGGASANAMAQASCINNAPGCGAGVDQGGCTNEVAGCGSSVVVVEKDDDTD